MAGKMIGGRGFGRGVFEKKTPPQGYICHRCKVPGHFIQHCSTNGDPNFDVKRVKPPTGIPKSMLMATPDGSYALLSGAVAVLKPNEAAFEKEIEGMPSTRSVVGDLPPELYCPLCKEVMKDAVLTSKCCFTSFCDRCIRDRIISKSMCVCEATNILADDLLPNKTLRDTINRILESNNNSAENGGSAFQVQDMESHNPQAKVPSPTQSAASKGQQVAGPPPQRCETPKIAATVEESKSFNLPLVQEKVRTIEVPDVSEATHDSRTVKEAVSRGMAPLADEEVQQKPFSGEAGKKKKKKRITVPPGAADMQWRTSQDLPPENYMMSFGPYAFNPYWNGIHPGLDGFLPPYGGPVPYMSYGRNPMDVAFGGALPHDPFSGPGCMLPYVPRQPQRDLADLAVGFNVGPPIMSREEFEDRKADLKRNREMVRREERQLYKDGEYGREGSSTSYVSSRSKPKSTPPSSDHHFSYRQLSDRYSSDRHPELPCPSSKKKSDQEHDHHRSCNESPKEHHRRNNSHKCRSESPPSEQPLSSSATADQKQQQKASVFSRISLPENDSLAPRKRKTSSELSARATTALSNGHHHEEHKLAVSGSSKSGATIVAIEDHDSSIDDRHFKRLPSRYSSSSPLPVAPVEDDHRHSRGTRERERDRGDFRKHR